MCQIEPDRSSVDAETQSRSSNRCHRVNNWINFEGGINRSPHFFFFLFHMIKSFRFGILGHAANLASNQKEAVDMVMKLMTTISCSFWRQVSVNFGSMLGWIIKSLLRCCTRCRSSRAWPALPRPWATCSNCSRYKQKSANKDNLRESMDHRATARRRAGACWWASRRKEPKLFLKRSSPLKASPPGWLAQWR